MSKRRIRALREEFKKLTTRDGYQPLPESSWRAFKRAWVRRGNMLEPFVIPSLYPPPKFSYKSE